MQDTPGFIVNRLLIPYLAEAVRMLERGIYRQRQTDSWHGQFLTCRIITRLVTIIS